jgi:hypothetical protein
MTYFMRRIALAAALCAPLSISSYMAHSQSVNAGDIRGTATDDSGALIPGVTVTVTNLATGVVRTLTTNKDGLYDTSSIVAGTYSLKFEKPGFQTYERSSVTILVGFSTINATMKVGSVNQEVVVTTDIPLLSTENGEQSTTFESKDMSQLPNVGGTTGPDWQNFVILLPGSAGTPQQSNNGSNPGQVAAINGNLPYNNVLADGVSTTLSHSSNSDVNTFETIGELQVNTSAFSAQYGIGGVVFNQISKGGTNKFHGTAYEYWQNDALNAAQYGFGAQPPVPFLRYNDFGGSLGGPVLIPHLFNGRDKAFFYFNYDQIINHGSASNSTQTIPTEAVKGGDFTGQHLLYDPTTQTMGIDSAGNPYPIRKTFLEEYGSNEIPSALFDKVSAAFQKLYPTPTNHIAGGKFLPGQLNGAGLLQNNWFSSLPQSTPYKRYFGRFDYNLNAAHRLSMTDQQRDTPVVYPNSVSACPVGCQFGDVDSNTAQVTEVWTISPKIVNEVRFGYTYQGNFYQDATLGKGYPAQLGWQFAKADSLPAVQFNGSYPYAWINPSSNAVYKEHAFDPSDVVTMIEGKHVLHFGGEFLIYQDNSTAWGNTNAGTLQFNGSYTRNWSLNAAGVASPDSTTGLDYADFLLGAADNWYASVSPEYAGRLKSPQVFVQDDYKVRPNLTINVGLRYQIRRGWSEARGNEATFDPTVTNPADGSKGAFWYGTTHANGRTQLQANEYKTFLPRVGFSWLPHPTTTIRGGFGMYAYNLSLDTYGSGMGGEVSASGGIADQTNGITPITYFDGTGTNAQTGAALPYSAASTDPARFNGQGVSANMYHTPTPRIFQYNLAMQNAVGTNMVFELAYVGSHGQNLNYPTDINAVPLNHLSSNDTAFRPYPLFQGISTSTNDGISNYNSFQASINRRLVGGLSFDANYTWAHFTDSQDSSGWGSRSGNQNYQIANNAAANYSNSNFDVHNAFKNRLVYQLPFGRGRKYMNKSWALDEALGGWQITTTNILQTGNPFSVTVNNGTTYQQAGSQFPNYTGAPLYVSGKNHTVWFNPAAFSLPAPGTLGNVRRNALYGPPTKLVNLSLGKTFDIREGVTLQFKADATNVLNIANFALPGGGVYGLSSYTGQLPGQAFRISENQNQITGTTSVPRTMQLSAHLDF